MILAMNPMNILDMALLSIILTVAHIMICSLLITVSVLVAVAMAMPGVLTILLQFRLF